MDLLKKTDYNAKITEIETKISSISDLATNAALATVENKIPNFSKLVKKTDYDAKISDIESKYITTAGNNKFTKDIIVNRIKSEGSINKSAIAGFINNAYLYEKSNNISSKSRIKTRAR